MDQGTDLEDILMTKNKKWTIGRQQVTPCAKLITDGQPKLWNGNPGIACENRGQGGEIKLEHLLK